ncbi:MAG: molybdenum cofactor biosynthesis protein MoaE [Methanomicrobiales archaeon]|nr:molybdenum cofactor biosynthesis protein MoaE [Methanomicrobiales archaeon]
MIGIQREDIDLGRMIERARVPEAGAIVVFDGIVRDDDIQEMELEAYREVALEELERIAEEARRRFSLAAVEIVHRIGRLKVGDNILAIVVSAAHRSEAYEGSRFIIEGIKAHVPIWKKELRRDGGRWVEGEANTMNGIES